MTASSAANAALPSAGPELLLFTRKSDPGDVRASATLLYLWVFLSVGFVVGVGGVGFGQFPFFWF